MVNNYFNTKAVDDFSFTPGCKINSFEKLPVYLFTTPAPDPTCVASSPSSPKFRCRSGECIDMSQLCNFRYDCSDSSDEATCPWRCNFDSI